MIKKNFSEAVQAITADRDDFTLLSCGVSYVMWCSLCVLEQRDAIVETYEAGALIANRSMYSYMVMVF